MFCPLKLKDWFSCQSNVSVQANLVSSANRQLCLLVRISTVCMCHCSSPTIYSIFSDLDSLRIQGSPLPFWSLMSLAGNSNRYKFSKLVNLPRICIAFDVSPEQSGNIQTHIQSGAATTQQPGTDMTHHHVRNAQFEFTIGLSHASRKSRLLHGQRLDFILAENYVREFSERRIQGRIQ